MKIQGELVEGKVYIKVNKRMKINFLSIKLTGHLL